MPGIAVAKPEDLADKTVGATRGAIEEQELFAEPRTPELAQFVSGLS